MTAHDAQDTQECAKNSCNDVAVHHANLECHHNCMRLQSTRLFPKPTRSGDFYQGRRGMASRHCHSTFDDKAHVREASYLQRLDSHLLQRNCMYCAPAKCRA